MTNSDTHTDTDGSSTDNARNLVSPTNSERANTSQPPQKTQRQICEEERVKERVKKCINAFVKECIFKEVKFLVQDEHAQNIVSNATRNWEIKICGVEAKYLCKFYAGMAKSAVTACRNNAQQLARKNYNDMGTYEYCVLAENDMFEGATNIMPLVK